MVTKENQRSRKHWQTLRPKGRAQSCWCNWTLPAYGWVSSPYGSITFLCLISAKFCYYLTKSLEWYFNFFNTWNKQKQLHILQDFQISNATNFSSNSLTSEVYNSKRMGKKKNKTYFMSRKLDNYWKPIFLRKGHLEQYLLFSILTVKNDKN